MQNKYLLSPIIALAIASSAYASTGTDYGNLGAAGASNGQKSSLTMSTVTNMGGSATPGQNPAEGMTNASSAQKTTVVVQCPTGNSFNNSPIAYPLGMATQCVNNGGSLLFRFCESTPQGGDCTASNNWEQQYLGAGQSAAFSTTLNVALQSCVGAACTLNVTQSGSFSGTGATLTQQGTAIAAAQGQNPDSTTNMINNVGLLNTTTGQMQYVGTSKNGANFAANIISNGGSLTSCFNTQQSQLASGKDVFVCDGSKSVNFGQSCTSTSSCIKYATTTTTYTQTCTANVPNNEIDVHTVTPTQVCTITNPTETHTCNVTHSPNVGITVEPACTPGPIAWIYGGIAYGTRLSSEKYAEMSCDSNGNIVVNQITTYMMTSRQQVRPSTSTKVTYYISSTGAAQTFYIPYYTNIGNGFDGSYSIILTCENGFCTWAPQYIDMAATRLCAVGSAQPNAFAACPAPPSFNAPYQAPHVVGYLPLWLFTAPFGSKTTYQINPDTITNGCTAYEAAQ